MQIYVHSHLCSSVENAFLGVGKMGTQGHRDATAKATIKVAGAHFIMNENEAMNISTFLTQVFQSYFVLIINVFSNFVVIDNSTTHCTALILFSLN